MSSLALQLVYFKVSSILQNVYLCCTWSISDAGFCKCRWVGYRWHSSTSTRAPPLLPQSLHPAPLFFSGARQGWEPLGASRLSLATQSSCSATPPTRSPGSASAYSRLPDSTYCDPRMQDLQVHPSHQGLQPHQVLLDHQQLLPQVPVCQH